MPLSYGIRIRQYIDTSEAQGGDTILVTFEDGSFVTLVFPEEKSTYHRELTVDPSRSSATVLEELWQAHERRMSYQMWSTRRAFKKLKRTHQNWRTAVKMTVSVRADDDTFDDSPRVGKKLQVMVGLDTLGCVGHMLSSPVRSVEFP